MSLWEWVLQVPLGVDGQTVIQKQTEERKCTCRKAAHESPPRISKPHRLAILLNLPVINSGHQEFAASVQGPQHQHWVV